MSDEKRVLSAVGRLTGLGTSAARLRPDAATDNSVGSPANDEASKAGESAAVQGIEGVSVWSEPRLCRMDVAGAAGALNRSAAGHTATILPGRSRLLYPRHWQSPYVYGNRFSDLLERLTLDWLLRFGLIKTPEDMQTIKEFECGLYGGLSSPTSNLRDGLIMTEFVSLWLFFDDQVIEGSTAFDLDDPVALTDGRDAAGSSNEFVNAWNDLCARIRRTQSEAFMQRFGVALKEWIKNAQTESKNAKAYQSTGKLPSFATMLDIRTVSIGMYPTFFLIEMAEGFELPDHVQQQTTIVELKRMASRLVGYGNDIGGLAKDLAGNWPNLVTAYTLEHGVPMESAFEAVIHMHNRDVEVFDGLERELPSFGQDVDVQVKEWVQAVRHSVLGFTLWESLAVRYQKWRASADGKALVSPVTVFDPAGTNYPREPLGHALRTAREDG